MNGLPLLSKYFRGGKTGLLGGLSAGGGWSTTEVGLSSCWLPLPTIAGLPNNDGLLDIMVEQLKYYQNNQSSFPPFVIRLY
jgi:hypothetical protein